MTGPVGLELRRGTGLLLAAGIAVTGVVLVLVSLVGPGSRLQWSVSGPGLVPWLNSVALLLGPMAGAAGAWSGSRERRLRVDELVAPVSRPRWQRDVASFGAMSVAVGAGLLIVVAATFATVAGAVTYSGGRWPLSMLLVALGYLAWLAAGVAAGRLFPYRWTAPAIGLLCYLVGGLPTYLHTAAGQLAPVGNLPGADGWQLRPGVAALGAGWLLALTVTALTAGAADRRRWAALPATVAIAAAVALLALPVRWTGKFNTAAWVVGDPRANERVCSTDTPRVCVRRVHANLLPEVTAVTRAALAPVRGYTFIEEDPTTPPGVRPAVAPGELVVIPNLQGRTQPFTGALRDPGELTRTSQDWAVSAWCPQLSAAGDRAYTTARELVSGRSVPGVRDPAGWLRDYLAAARLCDTTAFERLAGS
ncbi:hypothetical protein [Actinoplanes sp. NPDC049265]|uniref:hypothetical protein n=1 Tax=Actinoplanes sp. NPDC049265 TaxID=3363902 RepID=UPI00371652CE